MIYTVLFHDHWPILELRRGHFVTVDPRAPLPYQALASQPIPPNYDALLRALELGVAELVTPNQTVSDLAAVAACLGSHLPAPTARSPHAWQRPRPGHLWRLK